MCITLEILYCFGILHVTYLTGIFPIIDFIYCCVSFSDFAPSEVYGSECR